MDPLVVQGALKSLLNTAIQIITSSVLSFLYARVQLSHLYMSTVKTTALNRWIFVGKAMSLLFNMLARLVIAFLRRSKIFLNSWLQSPSAVILEPPKIKSVTVSRSTCHEVMRPDAMILVFGMLGFKPAFSLSSSLSSRGSLVLLHFLP